MSTGSLKFLATVKSEVTCTNHSVVMLDLQMSHQAEALVSRSSISTGIRESPQPEASGSAASAKALRQSL